MKAKIISIVIASLCISGFASLTYAEEYYGPEKRHHSDSYAEGGDYYPNRHDDPSRYHHREEHRPKEERKGLSISVNMPGYGSYVVENNNRHFVPERQKPHHRSRGPEWIDMDRNQPIPQDAVAGGFESGRTLFVCRANFRGGVHPGKVISGNCNISWGGNEISLSRYQVLTSYYRLNWAAVNYGRLPANAIPGGHEHGRSLYVCQAQYQGGLHPGKIIGQMCNIGWGGKEVSIPYYNVLVA